MSRRPLRFLLATTFFPPHHFGGDAICVLRLARALAEAGHLVDVVHSRDAHSLTASPELELPDLPNSVGVEWLETARPALAALAAHQLGSPSVGYSKRLREILRRPYDVVHFHNVSLLGGPGVLRYSRAPVTFQTAHEYWLVCATHVLVRYGREACRRRTCLRCTAAARRPPQWWRFGATGGHRFLARCLDHLDRLFVPSRFALEQHRRPNVGIPDDLTIEVLPHFVPAPREIRASGGLTGATAPYFLVVGRLEELKGVQDLLPLFRRFRDAELWIVGTGRFEEELRRRASDLPHVRFLGHRPADQLGDLYAGALALLAPSRAYETFGLTVAEAMAYGAPAVVRDHGALAELVHETAAGFAVDDFETAGDLLSRLCLDHELRREMGERGRRAAIGRWSRRAHLDAYFRAIAEVAPHLADLAQDAESSS